MAFLVRFTIAIVTILTFSMPVYAAVAVSDPGAACDIVAAEDGKKKPKEGEEEEPDCD